MCCASACQHGDLTPGRLLKVCVAKIPHLQGAKGFAGDAGCVVASLFGTAPTPMRREVVVARETQAEKPQASLKSDGSPPAACCSVSSCAKLCTNCRPRSATCIMYIWLTLLSMQRQQRCVSLHEKLLR